MHVWQGQQLPRGCSENRGRSRSACLAHMEQLMAAPAVGWGDLLLFTGTGFAYYLMGVSFAGLVPTAFCPGPLCWMYKSSHSPAPPSY